MDVYASATLAMTERFGVQTTLYLESCTVCVMSDALTHCVLLVDEDPVVIKALDQALRDEGHAVVTANGGQAGIDAFTSATQARQGCRIMDQ